MISEVELYRINIARKRAGLRLLSMAQARRAVEAHADVHGKFEITPFLVGYAQYEAAPEHDAVVATPSADFSPSSSDTSANGGDGW